MSQSGLLGGQVRLTEFRRIAGASDRAGQRGIRLGTCDDGAIGAP